mgnify:CR=1 FL=1
MHENAEAITLSEREARKWAMLCHLSALVGLLGNGHRILHRPPPRVAHET